MWLITNQAALHACRVCILCGEVVIPSVFNALHFFVRKFSFGVTRAPIIVTKN